MPLRGSVQLLLLSLGRRATRKAAIGAVAIGLLGVGAVQLNNALSSLGEDGLVYALRQSAWQQALADQSKPIRWPWEDLSASMSLAPTATTVPRLGLSAAMRTETPSLAEKASPAPHGKRQDEGRKEPARTGRRRLKRRDDRRQHHLHRGGWGDLYLSGHGPAGGRSASRRERGGAFRRRSRLVRVRSLGEPDPAGDARRA